MRLTGQTLLHAAPTRPAGVDGACHHLGVNSVGPVAELRENVRRPAMPTRPCERRVAVHVLGVDRRARVEQNLDRLFTAEGGGAMEGCLRFRSAVAHEAARPG